MRLREVVRSADEDNVFDTRGLQTFHLMLQQSFPAHGEEGLLGQGPEALRTAGKEEEGFHEEE